MQIKGFEMAKWTIEIEYEYPEGSNSFDGYWFAQARDEEGYIVEEFDGLETSDLEKLAQSVTEQIRDRIESLSGLIPQLQEKVDKILSKNAV